MNFRQWIEAEEPDRPEQKTQQRQPQWQKIGHQKEFPFMRQPDNPFMRRAYSFVPDFELDPEDDMTQERYGEAFLYHVTPNLSAVLGSGRLKSRSELGGQAGLGGGVNNEAPHMISMTYSWDRAKQIYDDFSEVSRICRGEVRPSQIWGMFDNDFDGKMLRALYQYLGGRKQARRMDDEEIARALDAHPDLQAPEDRYRFFQSLEQQQTEIDLADQEYDLDGSPEVSTTGFTAPFEMMAAINPRNLAIIQCVVRQNADIQHVMGEAEVRVHPADVMIVRYMQP